MNEIVTPLKSSLNISIVSTFLFVDWLCWSFTYLISHWKMCSLVVNQRYTYSPGNTASHQQKKKKKMITNTKSFGNYDKCLIV